jgi:hypothetical protein
MQIDWITNRKYSRSKISISATCEAMLKAFTNNVNHFLQISISLHYPLYIKVHSIYLISEGDSSDSSREILRDNIVKTRLSSNAPIPVHVASLFSHNNDTETFLRSIAQTADGRYESTITFSFLIFVFDSYFSYKIKNEVIDLKAPLNSNDPTRIKLQDNKLQFGTNALSSTPEYPLDISLMYKEILQCQNTIDRLDKILGFLRDENENPAQSVDSK